ncbi:probable lipase/esterase [Rhodococcus wratislaviensis]|uniref:Probable lipase/esterase n=1 Tax=Rhodococcus wratislaviensis TaxID=44752 RepID=A0A402CKX0_RHOWR|nr:probable lipase/esterase [Rhodococcus wratislaviensis]
MALIHGGWWRERFTLELMNDLARDLASRGHLVWNLEFRRIDAPAADGGWPSSLGDVVRSIGRMAQLDGVSAASIVAIGHSAGGHLGLLAARDLGLGGVVALAPITDLPRCAEAGLGESATPIFMGGTLADNHARYLDASPLHQVPIGSSQLIVHGTADVRVPVEHSRTYAERATSAGDRVHLAEVADGDHMFVLDPAHAYWPPALAWMQSTVS